MFLKGTFMPNRIVYLEFVAYSPSYFYDNMFPWSSF